MSSFEDFLRWHNNKDVVPTLIANRKMIAFYHDKDIEVLKLVSTLPKLANICLHKVIDAKFYPLTERVNKFSKKLEKMFMVVHLSFLHEKQLLMKVSFEKQPAYANLLFGLMRVNYTPTRCVNPCRPIFISVWISIQRQKDIRLVITGPTALKIWSCPFFRD